MHLLSGVSLLFAIVTGGILSLATWVQWTAGRSGCDIAA